VIQITKSALNYSREGTCVFLDQSAFTCNSRYCGSFGALWRL